MYSVSYQRIGNGKPTTTSIYLPAQISVTNFGKTRNLCNVARSWQVHCTATKPLNINTRRKNQEDIKHTDVLTVTVIMEF